MGIDHLVLSLFPGADLFGKPFERHGFTVVRGPEKILGQDIDDFVPMKGKFDGIIGGPPCQVHSQAYNFWGDGEQINNKRKDYVPKFVELVEYMEPKWAVMENVSSVEFDGWPFIDIVDGFIGGKTKRRRRFWFYGVSVPELFRVENVNYYELAYSVLATSYKNRGKKKQDTIPQLDLETAARLQGYPEIPDIIQPALPREMTAKQREMFIIYLLGNGVPYTTGMFIATHILTEIEAGNIK